MDEHLQQAYYEIVYSLLVYSPEKYLQVLQSNIAVIDDDFVPFLREICQVLVERNCQEDAQRLTEIATQIQEFGNVSTLIQHKIPAPPPQPVAQPVPAVATTASSQVSDQPKPKLPVLTPEQITAKQSQAEELFKQGVQQFQNNDFQEAFKSWQEALILYQEVNNYRGAINCLGKLGNIYHSLGQYEQAISAHQQCLAVARKTEYPLGEANAYSSLAHVCYAIGQHDQALFGYQQALEITQKINYRFGEVNVLGSLGQLYSTLGRYEEAIAYTKKAAEKAEELGYKFGETSFLASLGSAYTAIKQYDKAIETHHKALKIARSINYNFGVANSLSNIGMTYQIKGDLEQAIAYHKQHLQLTQQIQSSQGQIIALLNLGDTYYRKGEPQNAIENYQQALAIAKETGDLRQEVKALNNLGQTYQTIKDFDNAIQAFQQSLEKTTPLTLPMHCLLAARHLGDIGFSQQNWSLAISGYSRAIDTVENSYTNIIPATHRQEVTKEVAGLYSRMVQTCINANEQQLAFEYGERFRIQHLVRLLSNNYAGIDQQLTELVEKYQRLQQQIDTLHFRRQSDEMKQFAAAGIRMNSIAIFRAETATLNGLATQTKQLINQIRSLDPFLAGLLRVEPWSQEILQNFIHSRMALLSFYTSDNSAYIFIVKQRSNDDAWSDKNTVEIALHICPEKTGESLETWLTNYWLKLDIETLQNTRDRMEEMLAELSQRLDIDRLINEHLVEVDELLIIPNLVLHRCPFVALPIAGGEEFLGDRFRIRIAPSSHILNLSRQVRQARQSQPQSPITALNTSTSWGLMANSQPTSLLATYECAALAQRYSIPSEQLLNDNINRNQYQKLLKSAQVLYIGNPITFNMDNPLSSQLNLGTESISLQDLFNMRSPQLLEVFISRCQTYTTASDQNRTSSLIDQQFINFSSAFLGMGATTVIYPLWSAGEIPTAIFSQLYYQYRQEFSPLEALKQAQIRLRSLTKTELMETYQPQLEIYFEQVKTPENLKQINDQKTILASLNLQEFPFANPYYWAAFTLSGLG